MHIELLLSMMMMMAMIVVLLNANRTIPTTARFGFWANTRILQATSSGREMSYDLLGGDEADESSDPK